ncbi:UNVERIFIED_CONTAM: BRI1 kinase inhibitor 1 [Sesamum angustifolium]|uniref:BRI1 kinase inhibitor 1 n=1 Tax=Sesamum angustifolium TaxID=2727405 RepID=A0AAW2LUN3_9LAMI
MLTGKQEEEKQKDQSKREVQQAKLQAQPNPPPSASASASVSSSPSHEFSFTISLHPPSKTTPAIAADNKTKSTPPFALDLSPADEIFFHGHLLPLHLLSHLPVVSPRSSTNSVDSLTLPIKHLPSENNTDTTDHGRQESRLKGRGKSKSFSLFGLPRWRKGYSDAREKEKRKSKFDISNVIKRYLRLVKPFLSLRNRNGNPPNHRQPSYSFSGNLQVRSKKELRGRKGEFSAPASMRTSPTNSGHLVASGSVTPTKSDSTMEELQAAIQAAIAHCKKSIATDDKIKPSL